MADKTVNKSLELLINKFTEASNQTKELDQAISNFSTILETFYLAVDSLEEKINVEELSSLSKEALLRLNEIKSFNELQVLENLEKIIKKHVSSQQRSIQRQFTEQKKELIAKVDSQFQEVITTLNVTNAEEENFESSKKQDEILNSLKRIESQMKYSINNRINPRILDNSSLILRFS